MAPHFFTWIVPARQRVQLGAPGAEKWPGRHAPEHEAWPGLASKVPPAQRSHAVWPGAGWARPGRHRSQAAEPLRGATRPAGQNVQLVRHGGPVWLLKVPLGQTSHAPGPDRKVPLGHTRVGARVGRRVGGTVGCGESVGASVGSCVQPLAHVGKGVDGSGVGGRVGGAEG